MNDCRKSMMYRRAIPYKTAFLAQGGSKKKQYRHQQRGFSLLIAVGIIGMLSVVGVMVFNAVLGDVQMASGIRSQNSSLAVAEAGVSQARMQLINSLYGGGESPAPANLLSFPALSANHILCSEKATQTYLPCNQWRLLSPSAAATNGNFVAAVTCSPGPCATDPNSATSYFVRVIGYSAAGYPRLIEAQFSP